MSCIKGALDKAGHDIEKQLAASMHGLVGVMIRAYLPQRWIFVTDDGTTNLVVGSDGHFVAGEGPIHAPDVTIETSHARLMAALKTRDRSKVPDGPFRATPHTKKGRAALHFLKGRLGL